MNESVFIEGSEYKLGVHGRVFRFVNGRWVSSKKTPVELKNAVKNANKKNKSHNMSHYD